MVSQFIDAFNGAGIAREVTLDQLTSLGLPADAGTASGVMSAYAGWARQNSTEGGGVRGITSQAPPARNNTASGMARILGLIMAGQMVFFAFWTAANNSLSLLGEHENGTLARLFTTPANRKSILGAKFGLVAIFGLIQVIFLVGISSLVLNLRWGSPAAMTLAAIGMVVAAGGFGVFVISLLKNTRQAGAVLGGLLTVMGMLSGLFTVGFASPPAALNLGALFTPHGWVMRLWRASIDGAPLIEMLLPLGVCIAMGVIFFAIGYRIFNRRFA
jgi:ABC-type multidrug transport system permease subunit